MDRNRTFQLRNDLTRAVLDAVRRGHEVTVTLPGHQPVYGVRLVTHYNDLSFLHTEGERHTVTWDALSGALVSIHDKVEEGRRIGFEMPDGAEQVDR